MVLISQDIVVRVKFYQRLDNLALRLSGYSHTHTVRLTLPSLRYTSCTVYIYETSLIH